MGKGKQDFCLLSVLSVARASFDTNKIGNSLFPTVRVDLDAKKI